MYIVSNNIYLDYSPVFECFSAMFRINCHEQMVHSSKEQLMESNEMHRWVLNTRKSLTETMRKELEVFFNYESFFGLNLISYLFIHKKYKSIPDAISFLKETDSLDMITCFMKSGYNNEDLQGKLDPKDVTSYVKTMNLPEVEKWKLVFLYTDAERTKLRLVSLIEDFYNLFLLQEMEWVFNAGANSMEKLKMELKNNALTKLDKMLMLDTKKFSIENKIFIFPSVFYGSSSFHSNQENGNTFIYMYGTSLPHVLFQNQVFEDHLISSLKALADENRIKIIKILSTHQVYGYELAKMLHLSNSTVSHHIALLSMQGFLKIVKKDKKSYYEVNKELIKDTLQSVSCFLIEDE